MIFFRLLALPMLLLLAVATGLLGPANAEDTEMIVGGKWRKFAFTQDVLDVLAGMSDYDLAYLDGRQRWNVEGPVPKGAYQKDGVWTDDQMVRLGALREKADVSTFVDDSVRQEALAKIQK